MKSSIPYRQYGALFEKLGGAAALVAAVAFGVSRLLNAVQPEGPETDASADDYFAHPANRADILAAIERDKQGIRVYHELIES